MSINKPLAALFGATSLLAIATTLPTTAHAQTASEEANQAVLRLSVIFLEQVVGAWSTVLQTWDRDPKTEDWQAALERCSTRMNIETPKVIADADPQLPQAELLVGSVVFYRGSDGLQQLTASDGEVRKFPKLQIGRGKNDTPVYQISGSGGAATISIGKIPSAKGEFIVMVKEGSLLLRCQPNASE